MFDNLGATVGQAIVDYIGKVLYDNLGYIVIFFVVLFLIFLASRKLAGWYFKTDKMVALLEQIEKNTRPPAGS